MTIICPKCKTRLALPDEKLKGGRTKFKCSKCGASLLYKGRLGKEAEKSSPEPSVPSTSQPSEETTSSRAFQEDQKQADRGKESHAALKISGDSRSSTASDAKPKPDKQPETEPRKNTEASPDTLTQPAPEGRKGLSIRVILAGASGIIILVLAAMFFFRPADKAPQEQAKSPTKDTVTAGAPSTGAEPPSPVADLEDAPTELPGENDYPEEPFDELRSSEMSPQKAIEIVKRSDALLKNTPVDEIIRAWTAQKAGQYKVVGWQAKKIDEQKYLVSYTALDGNQTKGFYFDLDVESGVVQDLAHNQELQKKYNIQYSE